MAPDDLPTHANLGIALAVLGRHAEASVAFEQALALRPDDPALRQNLVATALNAGKTFLEAGQPAEAATAFRRATAAAPDHAAAHGSLGGALAQLGALDEAEAALRAALALAPDDARLHYNRAKVLQDQDRLDDAIAACRSAVALDPKLVDAGCLLGSLLRLRGEPQAALAAFEAAAATAPDYATAQLGLGGALHDLGRLDDAVAAFRRAQALDPTDGEAHRNESLSLLLQGDFAAGWAKFEWRWRTKDMGLRRWTRRHGRATISTAAPSCSMPSRGSATRFSSRAMCPASPPGGGRVILQVQRPLLSLLHDLGGVSQLIAARQAPPAFDVQAPLLSLPGIFGTRVTTIPADIPYLAADPVRVARWADTIGPANRGRRIGLVWAGNPRHWRDRMRSLPVRELVPLVTIDDLRLVQPAGRRRCVRLDAIAAEAADRPGIPVDRLHRDRRGDHESRPGDLGRHVGRASRRCARQAGLALAAIFTGLSLAARPRRQPVVSDHATVPAAQPGRLGEGDRGRGRGAAGHVGLIRPIGCAQSKNGRHCCRPFRCGVRAH
ncbi:MAG: tetratricopeptide repeat protein [Pseudomonadota bacterium]